MVLEWWQGFVNLYITRRQQLEGIYGNHLVQPPRKQLQVFFPITPKNPHKILGIGWSFWQCWGASADSWGAAELELQTLSELCEKNPRTWGLMCHKMPHVQERGDDPLCWKWNFPWSDSKHQGPMAVGYGTCCSWRKGTVNNLIRPSFILRGFTANKSSLLRKIKLSYSPE